ncbi:hypothetical protein DFR52_10755 [Hoeflea marina]|uniref:Uncharacterized protein n=1 Tax=Hoeflea marina TaxID=274592 RepID=A0A317PEI6_9HYPH|nr:hypothetical protein DFR52_10755 [Hoeflea marina]
MGRVRPYCIGAVKYRRRCGLTARSLMAEFRSPMRRANKMIYVPQELG